jgi:hypothetical protein
MANYVHDAQDAEPGMVWRWDATSRASALGPRLMQMRLPCGSVASRFTCLYFDIIPLFSRPLHLCLTAYTSFNKVHVLQLLPIDILLQDEFGSISLYCSSYIALPLDLRLRFFGLPRRCYKIEVSSQSS